MAELINLRTFTDTRGNLTVIEKVVPFEIKRIFYIYGVDDSVRGGHRHKKTVQAAVCLKGSCRVRNNTGKVRTDYVLDAPNKFLILHPEDYHTMDEFTPDAILMVLASEYFDADDYIYQDYDN
jgi:dTDP-4-dehydrorhamnose 3,5-epimerase-like enzyme